MKKQMIVFVDDVMCIIRKIINSTDTDFEAYYKDSHLHCWLDEDDFEPEDLRFYIHVTYKDGGSLCDGWMPEERGHTIIDAIQYAIHGACLVK